MDERIDKRNVRRFYLVQEVSLTRPQAIRRLIEIALASKSQRQSTRDK
jgi:hypothetical protein